MKPFIWLVNLGLVIKQKALGKTENVVREKDYKSIKNHYEERIKELEAELTASNIVILALREKLKKKLPSKEVVGSNPTITRKEAELIKDFLKRELDLKSYGISFDSKQRYKLMKDGIHGD